MRSTRYSGPAIAVALCAAAGLAFAGTTGQAQSSLTSSTFVAKAAQTGMAEVELGKIALTKSQNPDVRAFADRMVKDHSKANEELTTIAQSKNVEVPKKLDTEHQGMVEMMRAKSGADFDSEYAQHMAKGHGDAVALFTDASKASGLDHELAAFAQKTLPTLQEHKRLADQLAASRTAAVKDSKSATKSY
jgi:putative membrane protein